MKTRILFLTAAFAMTFAAISCSKSDDGENIYGNGQNIDPNTSVPDPEGTITVNMLNDKGTYVDDMYIDASNNFCASYYSNYTYYTYYYSDLGAMKGLGNITDPVTTGLTEKCAVIPGHGYWFYDAAMQFPSGKWAIEDGSSLYKLYVDSWILSGTSTILGAVVKYVPYSYHAPYEMPTRDMNSFTAAIDDIEYIPNDNYNVTISGNTIRWQEKASASAPYYDLYIRIGDSYVGVRWRFDSDSDD